MESGDTIYALATPPGRSGVAVVRVSGPDAANGLRALGRRLPPPRLATVLSLRDQAGAAIDRALVLYFKGPASFTGEDVVEYHVHGGRAVIQALIEALAGMDGHRLAEPGEFTRRAFEYGKMDLTAAEAVADLIDAETSLQKEQALAQLGGALATVYQGWSDRLAKALAHLEADIDFPDEDLPDGMTAAMRPVLQALHDDIGRHLSDNRRGERLRDGLQIAVLGAPNAGKSSLVNALAKRNVAIVSPHAGTTRDVIEAHLDIAGYPVTIADTAGLRPGQLSGSMQDAIEEEGIRLAYERSRSADLLLLVYDASQLPAKDAHTRSLEGAQTIIVFNKADLQTNRGSPDGLFVSSKTSEGLQALTQCMAEKIETLLGNRETPPLTRERHRAALKDAQEALDRALKAGLPELAAEDVRLAMRALGRITGRVDVEQLLDMIFRDFCIGK
jgi:tRNA modification GTPase